MSDISTSQRQYLRKLAHDLRPVVQIGKNGLTHAIADSTTTALEAHELIKVKFLDYRDEKAELARALAAEVDAELVALIGNIAVLFRQNRDPQKRKVTLPRDS